MRIGIDVDGVLADIISPMLDFLNKEHGKNFTKEDVNDWDVVGSLYGLDTDEAMVVMNDVWNFKMIPPEEEELGPLIEGMVARGHSIHIITKRYKSTIAIVIDWLQMKKIPYDAITFISGGADKLSMPIDILIDDKPTIGKELNRINGYNKQILLRSQPWNMHVETAHTDMIFRVDSMKEAIEWINKDDQWSIRDQF